MKNFKLLSLMVSVFSVYASVQAMSLEQAQQALTKITQDGVYFNGKQVVNFSSDDVKVAVIKSVLGKAKVEELTGAINLSAAQKKAILLAEYERLYPVVITPAQSLVGAGLFVGAVAAIIAYQYLYASKDTAVAQEQVADQN